jgi:hypothetical protein
VVVIARGVGVGPISAELGAHPHCAALLDEAEVPRQTSLTRSTAAEAHLARVAELGFRDDLPGYVAHRYVTVQWGVVAIARALRTSVSTVCRLLDDQQHAAVALVSTSAATTTMGHTAHSARPLPYDPCPSAPERDR